MIIIYDFVINALFQESVANRMPFVWLSTHDAAHRFRKVADPWNNTSSDEGKGHLTDLFVSSLFSTFDSKTLSIRKSQLVYNLC